ncbi:L-type lectin-domain containing receptor kinase IX.2 [Vitis vinifera]|uniref:L-type lectin-domain containing receptor kinase IX.2 n=1 Tax=Vitis vinifera TaxID=29760 RepID=A0A438G4X9_VITVI|nr:L-type lectin-domain containing receptor kinase IX.2 [Vitis vinifera]
MRAVKLGAVTASCLLLEVHQQASVLSHGCLQRWNYPTQSHKLLSFHLGFMISTFFFLIFPSATSLSFNFTTFEPNNGQISFEGEARYSSDDDIQLTRDVQDKSMDSSWGRAIYKEQLYLWDRTSRNLTDFASNFSFVINSRNKSAYGDGITFFLNVEFDTFSNKAKRDPVSDHVGIDINSTISVKTVNWSSNIGEGKLNHVSIRYTSSSQNLSVVLITEFMDDKTTSQSLSYKVDLREYLPEFVTIGFSGATGKAVQINNIYSWNFSSTLQPPNPVEPGDGKKTGFVVGLSVGAVVVVCGLGLVWHHLRKKRNSGGEENGTDSDLVMDEDFEKGTGPRKFSFDELALATSNFAEEEKLGEGGFGGVYRGFLRELNSYVAVKRVSRGSKQGMKEYASEVKIISRLRHRNLVQLMGWDIKSSNVMLDSDFNAKLGDFGLARLVDHGKGSQTTVLAGTMEICCGRRPVEPKAKEKQIRLVEWVWDLYGVGKLVDAADPRLSDDFDEEQMERLMIVGLWCAHPDCNLRPSIRQAINVLNSEASLPLLPLKMPVPMYYSPPVLQTISCGPTISESIHTSSSKLFESPVQPLLQPHPFCTHANWVGSTASMLLSLLYIWNCHPI